MSKTICLLTTVEVTARTCYGGFVRFLTDRGWKVIVISASAGSLQTWVANEGGSGFHVAFRRNPNPLPDLLALLTTYWLLRRIHPDIVVSATPKAGLLGTLAALFTRVPVRVYELWGLRLETEHGPWRLLLATLERIAMASATHVWANSPSLAAVATRMGLPGRKRIEIIGAGSSHGVDTTFFHRDAVFQHPQSVEHLRATCADSLVVGFLGRVRRDKGVLDLLRAVDLCVDQGLPVRLAIVGDPEDRAITEHVRTFVKRGLAIWATGVTDVRPYIAAIDVLCLPTYREGFPNVVLEAAAMSVPAIVSNATGAVDSVIDGETGWVIPTGDWSALGLALDSLSRDRQSIRMRGANALEWVRRHYAQATVFALKLNALELAQQLVVHGSLPATDR